MKTWICVIASLLFVSHVNNVLAVSVGHCYMTPTNETLVLDFGGVVSWPNGYQEPQMRLYRPYSPMAPIVVTPDPSGLNFLSIRSAVYGTQFWVTWRMEVIAISPFGVSPAGSCIVDPGFVGNFYRPSAPEMDRYEVTMDHNWQAQPNNAPKTIPINVYEEGEYYGAPLKATRNIASECELFLGDEGRFYNCVIQRGMGSRERRVLSCANESRTPEETALCILANQVAGDDRTNLLKARDCYAAHGQDWSQYPICMNDVTFDPKVMNAFACLQKDMQAGRDPDYISLGMCALGPSVFSNIKPNPEMTIVINCAIMTRGQPKAFAACAGGALTTRELDKCLRHGIGTDDGCFGPNNDLMRANIAIGNGIESAFGRNSVAYDAWNLYSQTANPLEAVRAMNTVKEEAEKLVGNLSTETTRGLENIKREANKVMPRITVKRPRVTIRW